MCAVMHGPARRCAEAGRPGVVVSLHCMVQQLQLVARRFDDLVTHASGDGIDESDKALVAARSGVELAGAASSGPRQE